MNFLGMDAFGLDKREAEGYERASGMTYGALAYMATDGATSGGPFNERTRNFLSRCAYSAYEIRGEFSEDESGLKDESAGEAVPVGNYDRWVIFTDLMGWESDEYYDALSGSADKDDPSSIPAYVLNGLAYRLITGLITRADVEY